jgi:hypothetical protein
MTDHTSHTASSQLPDIQAILENYSQAWKQIKTEGIAGCWKTGKFVGGVKHLTQQLPT